MKQSKECNPRVVVKVYHEKQDAGKQKHTADPRSNLK